MVALTSLLGDVTPVKSRQVKPSKYAKFVPAVAPDDAAMVMFVEAIQVASLSTRSFEAKDTPL
jgi:hypothetical protein